MLLALTLALATASPSSSPPEGTTHVEVDGHEYRVTVKNGTVTAASKRTLTGYSMDERDRQRAAVLKATGCRIVDEFDLGGAPKVEGRLDCAVAH